MERTKACSLFLGVKNVWTGSKIGVKILEITSADINAALKLQRSTKLTQILTIHIIFMER